MNGIRDSFFGGRTLHGIRQGSHSIMVNRLGRGIEGQIAYLTRDKKLYLYTNNEWIIHPKPINLSDLVDDIGVDTLSSQVEENIDAIQANVLEINALETIATTLTHV